MYGCILQKDKRIPCLIPFYLTLTHKDNSFVCEDNTDKVTFQILCVVNLLVLIYSKNTSPLTPLFVLFIWNNNIWVITLILYLKILWFSFFYHTKLSFPCMVYAKSERIAPVKKNGGPYLFSIYLIKHVNFFFYKLFINFYGF